MSDIRLHRVDILEALRTVYIQTVLIEFVAGQINGFFILLPRKGNCPLQQDTGQPLSSGLLMQIQLAQKQTILFRKLNQFIKTASVLGLFMMGALSSTYVKLVTPISWANAVGEKQLLQDVLNKIFPNILPLLVVFGIYFYIKKSGPKYVRILVSILVLSVVLSFFGIV